MPVTDETEAKVREEREKAIEYGERVLAGEEPWNDDRPDDSVEEDAAPRNDDVGENGEAGGLSFYEVDQDNPAPEPEE